MFALWDSLPLLIDQIWLMAALTLMVCGPFLVIRPSLRSAGPILAIALLAITAATTVEALHKSLSPLTATRPPRFVGLLFPIGMVLVAIAAWRLRGLRTPFGSIDLLRHEAALPSDLPIVRTWRLVRSQGACRWPSVLSRPSVIEAGEVRQRSDGHLEVVGWGWAPGGTGLTVLAAALLALLTCVVSPIVWLVLPIIYFAAWLAVHWLRRRRLTIDLATADRIAVDRPKGVVAIRFGQGGESRSYSARPDDGIDSLEAAIRDKYPQRFDPIELESLPERSLAILTIVILLLGLVSIQALLVFPMRW